MSWLKENWFKVGLISTLLITSLATTYYFSVSLPTLQKDEMKQELYLKLFSDCEKLYKALDETFQDNDLRRELNKGLNEKRCEISPNWFQMDFPFFCSNGISNTHTFESYIPRCIRWRIDQSNRNYTQFPPLPPIDPIFLSS